MVGRDGIEPPTPGFSVVLPRERSIRVLKYFTHLLAGSILVLVGFDGVTVPSAGKV
jgi:hypothetical protein